MSDITQWSPVDANNNAPPPDGFPEGMPASAVNDSSRAVQGAVRRYAEDGGWFDFGHVGTYIAATAFQVPGDLSAIYYIGRRVRAIQSGTITGVISFVNVTGAPNTEVSVTWDTGGLVNASMAISLGDAPEATPPPTGLGTAAAEDVGTAIGNVVQLANVGGNAGLPAVDGSQLTNLPAPPAGPVLADDRTFSAAATVEFTSGLWSGYNSLEFDFNGLSFSTAGAAFWLRVAFGGAYLTSGYTSGDVGVNLIADDGWPGASPQPLFYESAAGTRFGIAGDLLAGSTLGVNGYCRVYNLTSSPAFVANVVFARVGGGGWSGNNAWGWNSAGTGVSGVQFLPSAGTVTGNIRLYVR